MDEQTNNELNNDTVEIDYTAEELSEPVNTSDEASKYSEEKKKNIRNGIIEALCYLVFAILFITLVPKYVMERVSVEGSSMCETLHDGDQLIGGKISVRKDRIKRYDIIYFYPQGRTQGKPYIKRVIGLPGDKIQIVDSVIYVNDMPLSETFANEPEFESGIVEEPLWLQHDEYFVLGDNRNHSTDSRSSSVGPVKYEYIEGKAIFRIWPLRGFGKID